MCTSYIGLLEARVPRISGVHYLAMPPEVNYYLFDPINPLLGTVLLIAIIDKQRINKICYFFIEIDYSLKIEYIHIYI